ncbi:DedA family protein [Pseudonocardia humida]|nr:VTT domain-containing protein [Pseudonocardia humida]
MRTIQDLNADRPVGEDGQRAPRPARRWVPWRGRASRTDRALIATMLVVVAIGFVLRPLKPFLIASHPVLLEFLSGDLIAIGAAAAFARIGEVPLWLVVAAGALGMIKFDWLAWWAGRQWGAGIIGLLTASPRVQRWARRGREADPRVIRAAVVLAMLPGVPTAVVFALAGWAGLRLTTFLLLDAIGALAVTGLVAGLGFGLGQHAVDVVLLVDRYASAVSLALIGVALALPLVKRLLRRSRRPGRGGSQ